MCRISSSSLAALIAGLALIAAFGLAGDAGADFVPGIADTPAMNVPQGSKPELNQPLRQLFSHPKHLETFRKLGISCTDCHSFAVHEASSEPLSKPVHGAGLSPFRQVCHECHLGKVAVPRSNQCQLCHIRVETLKPVDHYNNWISRHGRFAQLDRDSCARCHSGQSCSECHVKRNSVMPIVHPPNYRLTHSIEARSNPQKCTLCHQVSNFCMSCHSGARQ